MDIGEEPGACLIEYCDYLSFFIGDEHGECLGEFCVFVNFYPWFHFLYHSNSNSTDPGSPWGNGCRPIRHP